MLSALVQQHFDRLQEVTVPHNGANHKDDRRRGDGGRSSNLRMRYRRRRKRGDRSFMSGNLTRRWSSRSASTRRGNRGYLTIRWIISGKTVNVVAKLLDRP